MGGKIWKKKASRHSIEEGRCSLWRTFRTWSCSCAAQYNWSQRL